MKTRRIIQMQGIILLLSLLFSFSAWATPESIGALVEAEGQVEINGQSVTAGAELRLGMRIVTGAKGRAVLKFIDGQIVALKEDSVFWIKSYRYEKGKPKHNHSFLELLKGGMRFISGSISKEMPESVIVGTPVATIGVRGTEFTAILHLDSLCVFVHEGKVIVTSEGGSLIAEKDDAVYVPNKESEPQLVQSPRLLTECDSAEGEETKYSEACGCRSLIAGLVSGSLSSSFVTGATGATAAGTTATGVAATGATAVGTAATGAAAVGTAAVASPLITTGIAAAIGGGAALLNKTKDEDPPASPAAP